MTDKNKERIDGLFEKYPWLKRHVKREALKNATEISIEAFVFERHVRRSTYGEVGFIEKILLLDKNGNILKRKRSPEEIIWWKPWTWSRSINGKVGSGTIGNCLVNLKEEREKLAFILSEFENVCLIYTERKAPTSI